MKKGWKPFIAVGTLVLGLVLGWLAFALLRGVPSVVIIPVSGSIDTGTRESVEASLRSAGANSSIAAVVLVIDSAGGQAVESEELYYAILQLRGTKPVVAVANSVAASGAYYAALGANMLLVKPSTLVGSIGAVSILPERAVLPEESLVTGPFKRQDDPRQEAAQVQQTVESFLNAVQAQRGAKLKLNREELSRAQIYTGIEAVRLGLADAIGTEEDAINAAAALAGIAHYRVQDSRGSADSIGDRLSINASALKPTNTVQLIHFVYVNQ
ncbi:S49 family peptidase [Candidatus Woesearchaeota archaeon]|nr:S49 family peptidase [Candidatus Woesearchaeota archaeon]